MATSVLRTNELEFKSNATDVAAKLVASNNTFTFSGFEGAACKLTGIAAPSASSDVATKTYVDSAINGLKWKEPVDAASTANVDIVAGFSTLDGVTTTTEGQRVLLKDQTTASQNGIYELSGGSWVRTADFNTGDSAASSAVFVQQGSTNGDKAYICTNDSGSDVIGTADLAFVQFGGISGAAGSDTQIQYNSGGALSAISTFTSNGTNVSLNGGDLNLADNDSINVGSGADLAISHDGTDSSIANITGDLNITNSSSGILIETSGGLAPGNDITLKANYQFKVNTYTDTNALTIHPDGPAYFGNKVSFQKYFGVTTIATVNNTAGVTLTNLQLQEGIVKRTGQSSAVTDTLPTAHNVRNIMTYGRNNAAWVFVYYNAGAHSITLAPNTDITWDSGSNPVIRPGTQRTITLICQSYEGAGPYTTVGYVSVDAAPEVGGSDTQMQYNNAGEIAGLSTVTTDGTNLAISGGNLSLADNDSLNVGTGSDLTVSHDGTDSTIANSTGSLNITNSGGAVNMEAAATSNIVANLGGNAGAEAFNVTDSADAVLFSVASDGAVTANGAITSDGLKVGDNEYIYLGDGDDLRLWHTGSSSIIQNAGTGPLTVTSVGADTNIRSDSQSVNIVGAGGNVNLTAAAANNIVSKLGGAAGAETFNITDSADVVLFSVASDGAVTANGTLAAQGVSVGDNEAINVGDGNDLALLHNGTSSSITNSTGDLAVTNTGGAITFTAAAASDVDTILNGGSSFTVSDGSANTLLSVADNGATTINGATTVNGALAAQGVSVGDNEAVNVGDGNDLALLHNGTSSSITNSTGDLAITNSAGAITFTAAAASDVDTILNGGSSFTVSDGSANTLLSVADNGATTINGAVDINGMLRSQRTVSSISGATGVTYSAAQFTGGIIQRTLTAAGQTDTLTAKADLEAAMTGLQNNASFSVFIENVGAETFSIQNGTGHVFVNGAPSVEPGRSIQIITHFVDGTTGFNSYWSKDYKGLTAGDGISVTDGDTVAVDATVVRTSGAQTISGAKTFDENVESTSTTTGTIIVTGGIGCSGNIWAGGDMNATAFLTTSDANLKKDIQLFDGEALRTLESISSYSYKLKADTEERTRYGVLAQELQNAGLGDLVRTSDDGSLKVDYNNLTGMLLGAVKELKHQVELLQLSQA